MTLPGNRTILELSSMNTPVCPIENTRVSVAQVFIVRTVKIRKTAKKTDQYFFIEPPDYGGNGY